MKHHNLYDNKKAVSEYYKLVDDMFYDIILNLRYNNITFDELAENLGITTEELLIEFAKNKKDFFVELEVINFLDKNKIYKNYNILRKNKVK